MAKKVKRKNMRKKYLWIIGLLMLSNIIFLGLWVSQGRTSFQLRNTLKQRNTLISQQKEEIDALDNTKAVRSFDGSKSITDQGLKGAIDALYNWNGSNYVERYPKAEKYMTRKVLAQVASGSLPTKKQAEKTAKAYRNINGKNKVTEIENGIQKIDGNNVTGFVWVTSQFSSFNKNVTDTQQVKYTYNLTTKKFTKFDPEPFSGAIKK